MTAYSPRDVAFSKILYCVPPDDGDTVNQGTLAGGSLDGTNTEGEGGVLTIAYTSSSDSASTGASSRTAGTYTVSPTGGSGTGLVLSITVNSDRTLDAAVVINGGKDYETTDTVTVVGTDFAGTTTAGDATLSPATVATAANSTGVSNTKRHFIPVNAPDVDGSGGIDYGTDAENLAEQRTQCENLIGQKRDSDDSGTTADEQIGYTVFGTI